MVMWGTGPIRDAYLELGEDTPGRMQLAYAIMAKALNTSRLVRVQRPVVRDGRTYLTYKWVLPDKVKKTDVVVRGRDVYEDWHVKHSGNAAERDSEKPDGPADPVSAEKDREAKATRLPAESTVQKLAKDWNVPDADDARLYDVAQRVYEIYGREGLYRLAEQSGPVQSTYSRDILKMMAARYGSEEAGRKALERLCSSLSRDIGMSKDLVHDPALYTAAIVEWTGGYCRNIKDCELEPLDVASADSLVGHMYVSALREMIQKCGKHSAGFDLFRGLLLDEPLEVGQEFDMRTISSFTRSSTLAVDFATRPDAASLNASDDDGGPFYDGSEFDEDDGYDDFLDDGEYGDYDLYEEGMCPTVLILKEGTKVPGLFQLPGSVIPEETETLVSPEGVYRVRSVKYESEICYAEIEWEDAEGV